MTTLTLIDPQHDTTLATLDLDLLAQEVRERTQVLLPNFFPPVALSENWYSPELMAALSATRGLLVRKQKTLHIEDRVKPLTEMTPEEITGNIGRHDITKDGQALVSFKMPVYEEDPTITTLVVQFDSLVSQLEMGHAQGALLKNSDYALHSDDGEAVAAIAAFPNVSGTNEEKAPVAEVQEEPVPVEEPVVPTVEEGIPAEALATSGVEA